MTKIGFFPLGCCFFLLLFTLVVFSWFVFLFSWIVFFLPWVFSFPCFSLGYFSLGCFPWVVLPFSLDCSSLVFFLFFFGIAWLIDRMSKKEVSKKKRCQ